MANAATAERTPQADLDLPDPLDGPAPPRAAATPAADDADDLIAQFADQQIDKLLADRDAADESPPRPADPTPVPAARLPGADALDALAARAAEPAEVPPSFEPPKHALIEGPATPASPPPPEPSSDAAAVARELALDAAPIAPMPQPTPVVAPPLAPRPSPFSPLLAVLAAVNAPVRNSGDAAREVVGAIAIVTLVNALAVLIYVMWFA